MPKGFRKILTVICIYAVLFTIIPPVQSYLTLPTEQKISVGDQLSIGLNFPQTILEQVSIQINDNKGILNFSNPSVNANQLLSLRDNFPVANEPGKLNLKLKLFGFIPLKEINVNVVQNIKLYPGGQAVGVLLRTEGVLVVGQSPIIDENGNAQFPAKEAGIKVGDTIVKVNDQQIQTDDQLAKIISELGIKTKKLNFTIKRNDKLITKKVEPIYCLETNTYRIGLYVRDNAGGVGTLTFYDPISKKYGALGHMIADAETNQQINIKNGKLVSAKIEGIQIGKKGQPGEKMGSFIQNSDLGTIEVNSFCGIFGTIDVKAINSVFFPRPLPVGFANQVEIGNAEILTVLKDQKIEKFSITIERVMPGRRDGKGMIISINDPKLIKSTGGIIQGMSGSPIIQNNKIIGAVTHVFINDPTRGYGIFIEDMLKEAGILKNKSPEDLGA